MCAVVSIILAISALPVGEVKRDEEVVFFNTWAQYRADTATWRMDLHGWIFERETNSITRKFFLANLVDSLELEDVLEGETKQIFEERAHWFLADNERGKTIYVRIGNQSQLVGTSVPDGHFFGVVHLPIRQIKPVVQTTPTGQRWIPYEAVMPPDDTRRFGGAVLLMDDVGLSVISDIDDTIKITGIHDIKTTLANTFLRPFEAAPGMAKLYRGFEAAGASFHYISESPWQLYVVLNDFLREADYPTGTWSLKRLRTKDEKLFDEKHRSESAKCPRIEALIEAFPRRQFVLIGDSGQKDPEIYGDFARKYPRQVVLILIRDVSDDPTDGLRYRKAFDGLADSRYRVFRDPREIGSLHGMLPGVSSWPATRPTTQPE